MEPMGLRTEPEDYLPLEAGTLWYLQAGQRTPSFSPHNLVKLKENLFLDGCHLQEQKKRKGEGNSQAPLSSGPGASASTSSLTASRRLSGMKR